ncbi:hypothetical protein [Thiomicrorhabdus indica]
MGYGLSFYLLTLPLRSLPIGTVLRSLVSRWYCTDYPDWLAGV